MNDTNYSLKFAVGSIDITPRHPVYLAGFGYRTEISSNISDRLEASAVLLKQGDESYIILSLDLLYVGSLILNEILRSLSGKIKEENVLVCATHTHFAPATDPSKPLLGKIDERYLRFVFGQLKILISMLLESDAKPCKLVYGTYTANNSINRRLFRRMVILNRRLHFNKTLLAPNPRGLRDEMIHTISVERPSGEVVCVIWNYCCHPVGSFPNNNLSADYPGAVRILLRKTYGEQLPVLFLQGFAGDIRPRYSERQGLNTIFEHFLLAPKFGAFTENEWKQWTNTLSSAVVKATRSTKLDVIPRGGDIWSKQIKIPLAHFLVGAPDNRSVSFHCMALGPRLRLIGISAEPVVEYILLTKDLCKGIIIPVGYVNDVFGYLPTENMIGSGGYEVDGFLNGCSLAGTWSPGFEAECLKVIGSLLN
jgi:neutral ceramidase